MDEARAAAETLICEKTKKGYIQIFAGAESSEPPGLTYFLRISPFERCVIASLRPSSVSWNIGNTLPI